MYINICTYIYTYIYIYIYPSLSLRVHHQHLVAYLQNARAVFSQIEQQIVRLKIQMGHSNGAEASGESVAAAHGMWDGRGTTSTYGMPDTAPVYGGQEHVWYAKCLKSNNIRSIRNVASTNASGSIQARWQHQLQPRARVCRYGGSGDAPGVAHVCANSCMHNCMHNCLIACMRDCLHV